LRNRRDVYGESALKEVTILSDGSSLGNGQKETRAAAVAVLGYRGLWRAVGSYLGVATNQQAEIAAATLGLEALNEPCRVRRKANLEWWQKLDTVAGAHKISWTWTKGHAGHVVQEAVDTAARRIASLGRVDESVLREAIDAIGATEL